MIEEQKQEEKEKDKEEVTTTPNYGNYKRKRTHSHYRSKNEIVGEILKAISENTKFDAKKGELKGITTTKIMYTAFLSYAQVRYYISFLLSYDLITKLPIKEYDSIVYLITEKGIKYLKAAEEMDHLIDFKKINPSE